MVRIFSLVLLVALFAAPVDAARMRLQRDQDEGASNISVTLDSLEDAEGKKRSGPCRGGRWRRCSTWQGFGFLYLPLEEQRNQADARCGWPECEQCTGQNEKGTMSAPGTPCCFPSVAECRGQTDQVELDTRPASEIIEDHKALQEAVADAKVEDTFTFDKELEDDLGFFGDELEEGDDFNFDKGPFPALPDENEETEDNEPEDNEPEDIKPVDEEPAAAADAAAAEDSLNPVENVTEKSPSPCPQDTGGEAISIKGRCRDAKTKRFVRKACCEDLMAKGKCPQDIGGTAIWNYKGTPRCRDAKTMKFVKTSCCKDLITADVQRSTAEWMCYQLMGDPFAPGKKNTNACKKAANGKQPYTETMKWSNHTNKVMGKFHVPGTFPEGYKCSVGYMCDPHSGSYTGPVKTMKECIDFRPPTAPKGSTYRVMCMAETLNVESITHTQ